MESDYKITIDGLISGEIEGKSTAIARYDEFIWKVRTGYAVFLYGSLGIIVGLVGKGTIELNGITIYSILALVIGFSGFAALLDYSFMIAKLRVVNYRDRLIELVFERTKSGPANFNQENELIDCLKNSGEKRESIDWSNRPGLSRLFFYYGGTCIVCIIASLIISQFLTINRGKHADGFRLQYKPDTVPNR